MNNHAYNAEQLRTNRASLFVFGGSSDDRRVFAEDVADQFPAEGALLVLEAPAQLPVLIERTRGVVFVPDVQRLSWEAQGKILQCLRNQEERAKWVLGLGASPPQALAEGGLRADLWYRLRIAQVDVALAEVQSRLKQRRARPKPAPGKSAAPTRPSKKARRSG